MYDYEGMNQIRKFMEDNDVYTTLKLNQGLMVQCNDNVAVVSHQNSIPDFIARFFQYANVIELELNNDELYLLSDVGIDKCQPFFDSVVTDYKNQLYDKEDLLVFYHPSRKAKAIAYVENYQIDNAKPRVLFRRIGGNYQYNLSEDDS